MGTKSGGVSARTFPPKSQLQLLEARMIYAERRRIIFAVLTIAVYLALLLSDFAMTISLDEQNG